MKLGLFHHEHSKLHCFLNCNLSIEAPAGLFLFSVVSAGSSSWWVGSACATLFFIVFWMLDLNIILYRNILRPGMLLSPSASLLISQNRVSLHPVDIEQMPKFLPYVSLGTQLQRWALPVMFPLPWVRVMFHGFNVRFFFSTFIFLSLNRKKGMQS